MLTRQSLFAIVAIAVAACNADSVVTPSPIGSIGAAPKGGPSDVSSIVYSSDFGGSVGGEWSANRVATAPNGERFLGEFVNDSATLNLTGLAAHTSLTVTVDVYAIRSWDGVDTQYGPDNFRIDADGRSLLNTTFSNTQPHMQNFPYSVGGQKQPAQKGAFAVNTLGYIVDDKGMDATYRVTYTIPHTSSSLQLSFCALGLDDESWGIDNVTISIR
jgi:hypothetical protein